MDVEHQRAAGIANIRCVNLTVGKSPDEERIDGAEEDLAILRALAQCRTQRFRFNLLETSFIIGREKLVPARRRPLLSRWRRLLFILMSKTALDATEFFRIPPNRVVELGGQIEI